MISWIFSNYTDLLKLLKKNKKTFFRKSNLDIFKMSILRILEKVILRLL